jgi:hypothetical protein
MIREEVHAMIERKFGIVPPFFKMLPDSSLREEWRLAEAYCDDLARACGGDPACLDEVAHLEMCRHLSPRGGIGCHR